MFDPKIILAIVVGVLASGAERQPDAVPLFNGRDLTGWTAVDKDRAALWSTARSVQIDSKSPKALLATGQPADGQGVLVARLKDFQGTNLVTTRKFGDCTIRVEFLLPKEGNSGIFLMALYELQLTDSTGIPDQKMQEGDHGGIPFYKKPLANAWGKAGEWQTCEITFQAPRFDATGKKTANAKILKAVSNGKMVQENLELPEPTGGGLGTPESPTGPLMLQGNESPVAFRNVTVVATPP